ncbi:MAG: M1 family metallopeptidase [Planctomycetes bacterium]|nr:M1 family metallopeptidase [Planctomycetota bacterium]
MRPLTTLSSVLCLLAALPAQANKRNASGGPLRPDQACFDVLHYGLDLRVDPAAKSIAGTLTMRAKWLAPQPSFVLDLDPALAVESVTLDQKSVPYERDAGRIVVKPATALAAGAEFTVVVGYGGTPHEARNPPWDGGFTWKQTKDGKPWIATSCQGEGADLWWPCKDHPSDKPDGFDLVCTIPKGLVLASNGVLAVEPKTEGAWTTFHWRTRQPIANYNIALNIAPYVELKETYTCIDGTKMPFQMWVLPESQERAKRCMQQFQDHLHVFEQLLGPYPFRSEKYGVAETPHLGMEHQTIIAYGNGFRDEQYDWLHNHELAHEWWGNLVTCRDWKDMWLHEGFGTYMQPLYREIRFGPKAYADEIAKYRMMHRTPLAPRESKDSHEIYFGASGNDIYYKGSAVLHTLRWHMGDGPFAAALRKFCYPTEAAQKATDGSQVRFVDTDDFVRLCSDLANEDLAWFFDVYVRQPSLPRLQWEKKDGTLSLRWLVPGDLKFELVVPVVLGGKEVRVPMPGGKGTLPVGDADWRLDPNQRLLMGKPVEAR